MLVTAGRIATTAGGVGLLASHGLAYPLLGGGLLLVSAGALVGHLRVAERMLAASVVVLLAPLLLVICLAVRLTSPGPALVRSVDPTGSGTPPLRFRTTFVDGQSPPATAPETRHTSVGRLLHRLCLDELPGLLDGLRGKMPLFRPRRG